MQLLFTHLILIGSAIGLAFLFGLRAAVGFVRRGETADLLLEVASVVVLVGLSLYFQTARARWRASRRAK